MFVFRLFHQDATKANELNESVLKFVNGDGRIFLSSTYLSGNLLWIRSAILNSGTHLEEIKTLLEVLKQARHKLMYETKLNCRKESEVKISFEIDGIPVEGPKTP